MLPMPRVIITDTSVLIVLSKIGQLHILQQVYGELLTTSEVAQEFGEPLPRWIQIQEPIDQQGIQILSTQIDIGEATAIALALQFQSVLLLIDDRKARRVANRLGLKVTGVLGVLTKAKSIGAIALVKPIIEEIQKTNFRLSNRIVIEVLRINGE